MCAAEDVVLDVARSRRGGRQRAGARHAAVEREGHGRRRGRGGHTAGVGAADLVEVG